MEFRIQIILTKLAKMKRLFSGFLIFICFVGKGQAFERSYLGSLTPSLTQYGASIDLTGKVFNFLNNDVGANPGPPLKYSIFVTASNGDSLWEKIISIPTEGLTQANGRSGIEFNGNYIFSTSQVTNWPICKQILFETDQAGNVLGTYTTSGNYNVPFVVRSHSGNSFFSVNTSFYNYYVNWVLTNSYSMIIEKHQSLSNVSWAIQKNSTTTGSNNYAVDQLLPTLDDGFIMHYRQYGFTDSSFIEKRDNNGVLQWRKMDIEYMNSSFYGAVSNVFVAKDSTYYLVLFRNLNNMSQGMVYHIDKNGNGLSNYLFPANVYVSSGVVTSDNKLNFLYIQQGSSGFLSGVAKSDLNFNSLSYYPLPFNSNNVIYSAPMVRNNSGGAYLAFREFGTPGYLKAFTVISFDSLLNTYPLKVKTKAIRDDNENCSLDQSDILMKNASMSLTDTLNKNYYAFSNQYGDYNVNVPFGTYTVSHTPFGHKKFECPPNGKVNFTEYSSQAVSCQFFDTIIPNVKDINVMLSGNLVSSYQNNLWSAYVVNEGTVPFNGFITVDLDDDMAFTTSNYPVFNYTNNVVTFSLTNLAPDSAANLIFNFNWNSSAQPGNPLLVTASVVCPGDINPGNNADTISTTIYVLKGSDLQFDPENSISVSQPFYVNDDKELVYTINFQNILYQGIKDMTIIQDVDSSLDISSIRVLNISHHNYKISHKGGNKIVVRFDNINLTDKNVNDSLSRGKLTYSVKFKPNIPPGTIVKSTASLFYDWEYIGTNSTQNVLRANVTSVRGGGTKEETKKIEVYPNPSNGVLYFKNLQLKSNTKVSITDVNGRVVRMEEEIEGNYMDVSGLKNGFYMLNLQSGSSKIVFKLMIIK